MHGEVHVSIHISVSTRQVEFALRDLSFFILIHRVDLMDCSGDFLVQKRTVLLLTTTQVEVKKIGWDYYFSL